MSAILYCKCCSGNVVNPKTGGRVCDIDSIPLTTDYVEVIHEFGCSYFTYIGIPRKNSKEGKLREWSVD